MANRVIYHAVEKNIPLPEHHTKPFKYPWRSMQVGDSFTTIVAARSRNATFYNAARQQGIKIKTKFGPIAGETREIRVWRIE